MSELAEEVPGLNVVGFGPEDFAVGEFCSLEATGFVMLDAGRENFADRGHADMIPRFAAIDWSMRNPWSPFLRSEEHTSELQSRQYLVCRLLLEKKKKKIKNM